MLSNAQFWYSVLNIFLITLLSYSLLHKMWEKSLTTMLVNIGFLIFSLLAQFTNVAATVVFLIIFISFLYLRATIKPKDRWYINEVH